MKIVETDNFGSDYPDESFVNLPSMPEEQCRAIAKIVNDYTGEDCSRFWKVVENEYELRPGFEP